MRGNTARERNIALHIEIEVWLLGNSSSYLVVQFYFPTGTLYRDGTSTNSDRGSGLDNSYCSNYLAICHYLFQIKNFFSHE